MHHPTREDRIAGCLLAGALGDAIGAAFEGHPPNPDIAVPQNLRFTDDTQLTIATCESIIESRTVDPGNIAQQFVKSFLDRQIDGIGASTLKSLMELSAGGHWASVGAVGERSAGNGAAMRIAPLAFVLDPDIDSDRRTIRDICRITHRNDEAYAGALAIVRSIRHALAGNPLDDQLISTLTDSVHDSLVRDRLVALKDSSLSIEDYADRFGTSGYVVDSVPIAILSAVRSSDLVSTFHQIIRCGGDTDTIASMFGQIFGAAHGTRALPMEVVDLVDDISVVRKTAERFSRVSEARQ
ncbi:MAG TPA: ADP-ribosylglycohydrolase family protein [Aridibacter sp.]|nr:ADP-ribosylglycohydrolase family protein [Aridibacter sp.]